jgi:hypothetical protein
MLKIVKAVCAALAVMFSLNWIPPEACAQLLPPLVSPVPGSLVVTMTSPASGSTVAGTITVDANVSMVGSRTVQVVRFFLDGASLGADDPTAPYSVSWDTTTASNGSHTLTAVARDAFGLQHTSNAVAVTVSNSDTTPPTVSITSPASGATVGGTISVTASASDNVGVAGVQFRLGDGPLGAEDTTAPYEVSWDTTGVSNGSHNLTAVARDAAGNITTSLLVTVTVSNAAAAPTVERFEETDPSITYTAGWIQGDTFRAWSAGTAAQSVTPRARATFTFTGTSASWIGARTPQAGMARVYLDGVFVADVDTFSNTDEVRVPIFTVSGLADASHTFAIEVSELRNLASTGTLIVVDAFDVPAATISRLQETDPALTYTAGWIRGDALRAWSASTAAHSVTPGAQATFTFTGTSISWIGARGPQTGIARVLLDGIFVAEVDTYAPTEQIQAAVFTATGLADATHTLTIEVTVLQNPASTGTRIVVDAFDVTTLGTRFEETDRSVTYSGVWGRGNQDRSYSGGTAAESDTPGAQTTFTFTGTSISWIGGTGPQTGIARVFLDGRFVTELDTYSSTEAPQKTVFTATDLAEGSHTLTIEVTGEKNPASARSWIMVDAFDVRP